jgi:hypothetical protein
MPVIEPDAVATPAPISAAPAASAISLIFMAPSEAER